MGALQRTDGEPQPDGEFLSLRHLQCSEHGDGKENDENVRREIRAGDSDLDCRRRDTFPRDNGKQGWVPGVLERAAGEDLREDKGDGRGADDGDADPDRGAESLVGGDAEVEEEERELGEANRGRVEDRDGLGFLGDCQTVRTERKRQRRLEYYLGKENDLGEGYVPDMDSEHL